MIEALAIFFAWWLSGYLLILRDACKTKGQVRVGQAIEFAFMAIIVGGPIALGCLAWERANRLGVWDRVLFSCKRKEP